MKKLILKTPAGDMPIEAAMAEKYGLKGGTNAPFTGSAIVDTSGEPPREEKPKQRPDDVKGELVNDGIKQLENGVTLQQSEIIDFGNAEDSKNG